MTFEEACAYIDSCFRNQARRHQFSREEVQDMAQEAKLKAWTRLDLDRCTKHTLVVLVRNVIIDEWRKKCRRRSDQLEAELPSTDNHHVECEAELKAAILELNEPYRQAAWLHLVEGLTHKESATYLGINSGTFRNRYARARKKMQENMLHSLKSSRLEC